jgi:hypothetical protein
MWKGLIFRTFGSIMKKITFLFLLLSTLTEAQIKLSDKAEISAITFGPYQGQVFTAFGHSAFRVNDPENGIDAAFNYGVFDFDKPFFYLDFALGQNFYMLGVARYKDYENYYIRYNRYIHEQKLNLTTDQKQKLFDYLQWNALPENKSYRYDYFYDNCATKLPAVMLNVFGDTVKFDGSYITTDYSIRDLTDIYLKHQPWGDLGIDIGLGLPMDKKATPYEYMFLPDYVESGFDHATIENNGIAVPLVKEKIIVYESLPEPPPATIHPLLVFSLIFAIIGFISYRDIKRQKLAKFVDTILFTLVGVVGLVLLLLWVATDHKAAAKNFNLLWALPTHLVAVIALIKNPKWLEKYFLAVAVISILLLVGWPFLPQKMHYALIPLVMALGLRAFTQYLIRRQAALQERKNLHQEPIVR